MKIFNLEKTVKWLSVVSALITLSASAIEYTEKSEAFDINVRLRTLDSKVNPVTLRFSESKTLKYNLKELGTVGRDKEIYKFAYEAGNLNDGGSFSCMVDIASMKDVGEVYVSDQSIYSASKFEVSPCEARQNCNTLLTASFTSPGKAALQLNCIERKGRTKIVDLKDLKTLSGVSKEDSCRAQGGWSQLYIRPGVEKVRCMDMQVRATFTELISQLKKFQVELTPKTTKKIRVQLAESEKIPAG